MRIPHGHVSIHKSPVRKARVRRVRVRAHTRKIRMRTPKPDHPLAGSFGALAYEPEPDAPAPDDEAGAVDDPLANDGDEGDEMPHPVADTTAPTFTGLAQARRGGRR